VGDGETLSFPADDNDQDATSFHHWFAMRTTSAARAAVAFTTSPEWLGDSDKTDLVARGDDDAIASAILHDRSNRTPDNNDSDSADPAERVLDLCAGTGTVAAVAARLGFDALSVELSIVPHLIDRVLHDWAISLREGTRAGEALEDGWRGFAAEVEDFANKVWDGARERLGELLEEDLDIRLWVRVVRCPNCGRSFPPVSNAGLSRDAFLKVSPESGNSDENEIPRFGLLSAEISDGKGTFAKGFCTCPACHFRFRFQGHELIRLRPVPIAVRTRNSTTLTGIDSPDAYVRQAEAAAERSIAASSSSLGNRSILARHQSIFHDGRGESISVDSALLPRQRAYFAAFAASMDKESKSLVARATLTEDQRFAIRSAVALLISGQIYYVNTYRHWLVHKPNPSTVAGTLPVGPLFTEAGGHRLERLWQGRLQYLLIQLRDRSSSARAVRAIQADAAAIPLDDSSVSAVVWDLPYFDKFHYDVAGEPYQAILAAMIPDRVSELVFPPMLPPPERTERYKRDLLQQATEARRVVSSNGSISVFWLAKEPAELQRFLELIAPAGLQLLRALRLDTIRRRSGASTLPGTYLLVLQPIPAVASAVVVDAEKVLALATAGALSLYDGLAELLESKWGPDGLDRMIPEEFHGSSRQRLAAFLAGYPEPEQLLFDLGRPVLADALASRDAYRGELNAMDARGLAQQLLAQLGFAVPRPVRFSIRGALREGEVTRRQLELAESHQDLRGAFLTCCSLTERILRYASLAWAHLGRGNQWNDAFAQIVNSGTSARPYLGQDRLTFGQNMLLFTRLPVTFAEGDYAFERALFAKIAWALKKAKAHEKLSSLVTLRNSVEHNTKETAALSLRELRSKCHFVLSEASAALESIHRQQLLPLTVRPEEERRDRYGRRVLRMLDPDGIAIEAYVESETDLTEPLIYFASDTSRRDVDPRFLRAAIVEELLGLT